MGPIIEKIIILGEYIDFLSRGARNHVLGRELSLKNCCISS